MARLSGERADDDARTADFWRQVFQADKSDAEARQALLRLYEPLEKWKELVDVLRIEVDEIPDSDVAAKLVGLRRLVKLTDEHLKQDVLVVQIYGQILELDPEDDEALDVLTDKYESMRRWPDLISLLEQQAERAEGRRRTSLRVRIAKLYLDRLRNQVEAIKAFEAVLADDPNNRDALEALDQMYEKRRDWDNLVAARQKLADLEEDPDARLAKYKELATYADQKIRRPNITQALWEQVREIAPDDVDALRALVGAYEAGKEFEALVTTIDILVDLIDDAAEQVDLLQKSGSVLQDRMDDKVRAVPVWQRLLAIDPEHRRAGDSLKKALIELGDWDALTEFFASRDGWAELVRILEGQVGVQGDDAVKIDLLFRAARIYEEQLDQQDRAVRALERVLHTEPENIEAARALAPIYEQHQDWRKLAGVIEVLLAYETDGQVRRKWMMQSAEIAENSLRQTDQAFAWVRRVIEEHPADAEARAELQRLGALTNNWPTVHDDLAAALARVPDSVDPDVDPAAAQLEILLCLAGILDEQMGALEESLARYHQALELDPENRTALDAVEVLYTRTANWHALLGIVERKLALAEDLDARKELYRKQGAIYEEQLEDTQSAIEQYRNIITEDEADKDALAALHRLYESTEQHHELHEILTRELELALGEEDGAAAIALKMQIGLIELHALGQTPQAIDHFRAILDEHPDHVEAREALEALLEDAGFRAEVARILEPIYRGANEWAALARALEIQLEETFEAPNRVVLLERIGTLHVDRTLDLEAAFDAFARLLREQPDSEVAIGRLGDLAEATDRFEPLAELIEQVLPDVSDDALAHGLLARLAEIYEMRLDNVGMAIDAHRRVIDLNPDERVSIEALDRLYTRSQQWPELLAIYRRKLEMAEEPDAREALQFQIANLLESMLGDAQEAITTYGEILQNTPENQRALEALDRLYGQEGMWPELADALERRLALADEGAAQIELRVRLGTLHEQALGNLDMAIETYRSVLEADPDNEPALEALVRLIEDVDHRAAVADILEPIYERKDDWQALIGIYEIQREFSLDPHRKVELLHRIAKLHQERGADAEEAFRSYARALEVDPGDQETLAQLHHIAEALELWADLVAVYESLVDHVADGAVAAALHKRTAEVQLRRLQDVEGARYHYESAWQSDDTDMVVIAALEEIYLHTEQWHELIGVLLRKCELTEAVDEKKELYFRVSALYEEMVEEPERAVDIYRTILELDAADGRALDALERLFSALERWEDLLEVLQRKAELTEDIEARKQIFYSIGASYERELDDLMRAVETYNAVLEWDPRDLTALQCLDQLYQRLESWDDLLGVLKRQVEVADETEVQLALRFRIAQLYEVHLEDVETAIEGYRSILADQPTHEHAIGALEGLIRQDRLAAMAAAVVEPVLTQAGAWDRLIAMWGDLLEVTMDLERRTELRLQIGRVYEDMLADSENAFLAYGEAFREDPTHGPTLSSLERVARLAEMWPQFVELVENQLLNIPSEYVARDLYLRVARVFEEELGDTLAAIERFRRVMEIDPDHEGAILALDRLYQRAGQWPELADILQLRVERAEDVARVPLLLRLGALYENALEEVPQAISAYKDVLDITAQEPEAVASLERLFAAGQEQPTIGEVLEPIYLDNEDYPKLHDLLQALLAHQEPGFDRMRAMHRLAELSTENLKDVGRAFEWYGAAFREVPEDEHTRREVARLAEETNRFEDLVGIYTEGLNNTQDLELMRSVSHEMATIYRRKLQNDEMAEQMYRYVLDQIDPADVEALRGLDVLYEEQSRWQELVDILQRELDAIYDEVEVLKLMYRLGRIYEQYLAEQDLAINQFRGILDREPNHEDALARLEQIYVVREEWDPLFEIYARQAENAEHDAERAGILAAQANLAANFLDRPDDAIALWNQVLDLRGEDAQALMALEALYQSQESWRELVDVCERQVNLLQNDSARELQLHAKLGRVWGDYLERERNALENWHKVLELDPANEEALWAVRDLYDRTSEYEQLAKTDHRLLELLAGDDERRVDLHRQLGRLYHQVLESPADAIQAWTQLLAHQPYDPEAIDALEELYSANEDWAACVAILERKVEITEDAYEKVSILFRVAEMYEQQLGEPSGAQDAFQKVLAVQPSHLDAYQELERLYEEGEQYDKLVELLLSRLQVTDSIHEQLEIYQRTAVVFEQRLGNIESAFVVLSQAFEASRDDEMFGAELERLAEAGDYWSPIIDTYQRVIEALGTTPESVPLRLRVARWWDEKLNQAQHAAVHFQHVLAIEPDNVDALTALELLLERYENWPEVVNILRRKVELVADADEAKASWEKMARILERQLGQPDAAIDAYRQVLMIDASDLESLQALENLYTLRMRWQELIDVLVGQTAVLTEPQEIVDKYLQVGELWETRLNSPERAIEAFRQALSVDDRCVDAMRSLERLYAQQDMWVDLLDVLELMLAVVGTPEEQKHIYRRIAEIQEHQLKDPYATIEAYGKLMVVDPRDLQAVQALDRLYREAERWDDLADVYAHHLGVIDDPETIVLIRGALAEIRRGPLQDPTGAIEALRPILDIDPNHVQTLRTLGELYRETEDWHPCIDVLSRQAHLSHDRVEQLQLQYEVGRIWQEKVGDLEQAETWFRSALEHDRNYLPALGALKEVNEARGEWDAAVQTLQMMEAATRNFAEKSVYLFQIGQIFDKQLDERVTAIDYYEQAMDMSPENFEAASPLVEVYWKDRNWPRAEPLLDLMLRSRTDADIRELQELNYRIAYCAEQLHKDDKALTHYRQAYELDSTHLPTLRGMGDLLFRHEDWDRAFKIYQTILVHHRESLGTDDVVQIFHQQGLIKLKQGGERRKALDFFRKALDLDPNNLDTLRAVIELHTQRGDWEDVIHYKRQLVTLLDDSTEKFQELVSVGDVLHEQMHNSRLAVDAYHEALKEQPGSRLVLSKLIGLHEEASNWEAMVDVLGQLADQEQDAARKAKYWRGVALVQRDKLKDRFMAVRSFDKALDADPKMLQAFQDIDQILTEDRDYERQDRYYRKMIKRAMETGLEDGLVFSLAKNLGEINRSRLQKYGEAIKAYKIALSKKPEDVGTHQILAQLYELEDQADKAIAQHYDLLKLSPTNVESYQQLRRLFMESGRYDEAWCVCQVLVFINKANQDEKVFFEKYRSRTLKQAQRPLDQRHWTYISHPDKSVLLDHLFGRLYQYTLPHMCVTHKDLRLHKRKSLISPDEQTPFNNVMQYVAQTTRLMRPECYRDPANRPGLRPVNLNPPALLVGPDILSGRKPQELAFGCAKEFFMLSQQNFLANIDETYERRKARLAGTIYTLMRLVNPGAQVQYDQDLLVALQGSINPTDLTEMAKIIQRMSADPKVHLNISHWLEMVEHTANRLGMLLANDLQSAVQVIRNEAVPFSRAPAADRIRELVLYSVSQEYFELRRALGLAIGQQK
ncbi:MAG: tetratricopeptide repeat protein [Myxococcales bacterium]|nr:tetratricopeptide repeat protein [Myxococcales bacterium]